mmetsp:Transcript_11839/g.34939  ORF Transcript_11839/g.34939 Transcript_11839/m.34939 type:complete len:219 (-) Transcript_11839:273-929(-)
MSSPHTPVRSRASRSSSACSARPPTLVSSRTAAPGGAQPAAPPPPPSVKDAWNAAESSASSAAASACGAGSAASDASTSATSSEGWCTSPASSPLLPTPAAEEGMPGPPRGVRGRERSASLPAAPASQPMPRSSGERCDDGEGDVERCCIAPPTLTVSAGGCRGGGRICSWCGARGAAVAADGPSTDATTCTVDAAPLDAGVASEAPACSAPASAGAS